MKGILMMGNLDDAQLIEEIALSFLSLASSILSMSLSLCLDNQIEYERGVSIIEMQCAKVSGAAYNNIYATGFC